ncbi:MAG TPA: hypothetical protein VE251_10430, partial [Xanthobacteraceae bacterium]|nr:hypothetical protein [Xanthobacteraceae bacterium]
MRFVARTCRFCPRERIENAAAATKTLATEDREVSSYVPAMKYDASRDLILSAITFAARSSAS